MNPPSLPRPCQVWTRKYQPPTTAQFHKDYLAWFRLDELVHPHATCHCFSTESDDGNNEPVAVVELPNGEVGTYRADRIVFTDRTNTTTP